MADSFDTLFEELEADYQTLRELKDKLRQLEATWTTLIPHRPETLGDYLSLTDEYPEVARTFAAYIDTWTKIPTVARSIREKTHQLEISIAFDRTKELVLDALIVYGYRKALSRNQPIA